MADRLDKFQKGWNFVVMVVRVHQTSWYSTSSYDNQGWKRLSLVVIPKYFWQPMTTEKRVGCHRKHLINRCLTYHWQPWQRFSHLNRFCIILCIVSQIVSTAKSCTTFPKTWRRIGQRNYLAGQFAKANFENAKANFKNVKANFKIVKAIKYKHQLDKEKW